MRTQKGIRQKDITRQNKKQTNKKESQPSQNNAEFSEEFYLNKELDMTLLRTRDRGLY
jgi:hypothetical protein